MLPLQLRQRRTSMPKVRRSLPEIEGGSIITWVHDHHLVMRQTLFIAGERIVPLNGDLAI